MSPPVAAAGAVIRCLKAQQVLVELDDGADTASVTGFPDGFSAQVDGGAGNDTLRTGLSAVLDGGEGNDVLEGGPAGDILDGYLGDDTIRARGGGRDLINCGPGRDVLEADAQDVARPDPFANGECEGNGLLLPRLKVSIARLSGRRLTVPVVCTKSDCAGEVRLIEANALGPDEALFKLGSVKAKRFKLRGGATKTTLTWRLTRRLAARVPRGELTVRGTLTDSVGHKTTGLTTLTLL